MTRVHAEALALVNWRGIFYERFELDRHVTGLEGDNGAGKTTVMIAAYVVLLPDMTRLRFTNLGESGATGGDKGIWGRLGETGRPSYAVLDFWHPRGERLLAGVHLERKGEPTVEPTPFIVTGLARAIRLQDILLLTQGELDGVPERDELRDIVARLGGRIEWFSSAREYFAKLFELGITPLRLGTDEERNKLNEMLRTSMTGGMSRGLLTELRSFLLKEEVGLADTLQRMRANLDACRRTRSEVQDAQRLEREITAIYEAGDSMFATAVAGNRQRAEESQRRMQEAESRRHAAEEAVVAAETALEEARSKVVATVRRKEEAALAMSEAQAWMARVADAMHWAHEVQARSHAMAQATERWDIATEARSSAERGLEQAQLHLERASSDRERAAQGLGDLQQGLEELNRRADAHQRVQRRLADAQRLLKRPRLVSGDLRAVRHDAASRLTTVDNERTVTKRQLSDTDRHRKEHASATAALVTIADEGINLAEPLEAARMALARVDQWSHDAAQKSTLTLDLREAEIENARQTHARTRAEEAGLPPDSGSAAAVGALEATEAALALLEQRAHHARSEAREGQRAHDLAVQEVETLRTQAATFHRLAVLAARIALAVDQPVSDRRGLETARALLHERRAETRARMQETSVHRDELLAAAANLLYAGGAFPEELLRVRDDLGAELLATRFDDVEPSRAAQVEAYLGHLAQALIVSDVDAATSAARARPESLTTLWLVSEGTEIIVDARSGAVSANGDAVVDESGARRITRIPGRPTLGRAAREQRASEMQEAAEDLLVDIDSQRFALQQINATIADADALLEGISIWLAGDAEHSITEAERHVAEAATRTEAATQAATDADAEASRLRPRLQLLRDLLPDSALLDATDRSERVTELRHALADAELATEALARAGNAPTTLRHLLDALREAPLSDIDLEAARMRLRQLDAKRDTLNEAIEAIDYVADHLNALQWADAAQRLAEQEGLAPALRAQLDAAIVVVHEAQAANDQARELLDTASRDFNERDAQRAIATERLREATTRLASTGVAEPNEALLMRAQAQLTAAREASVELDRNLGEMQKAVGARESALTVAKRYVATQTEAEESERRLGRPFIESWQRLYPQIDAAGLNTTELALRLDQEFAGRGSVNLFPVAQEKRAVLFERLQMAMGGREVLEHIDHLRAGGDVTGGEAYLHIWLAVRTWLLSRLPAHIADVDEPLTAMVRFRDHLTGIEERLGRQEQALIGTSEGVARGIDVQVRKARGRVQRLNSNLQRVAFGSIRAIRVQMAQVERMQGVLKALRSGDAQGLLFESTLPVEEALERIIQQYAGGRGGGQKMLDYREYLHLEVEVRRQEADTWETASPTRLSTGEAIGVGAALMMVVLTEWEHDANLLRGQRTSGSMRFLFLDEANRLDDANFGTVLELCRHLDLQLLVAAPDVARAEGCTVYRLTRGFGDDGRESVLVSGRRAVARLSAEA